MGLLKKICQEIFACSYFILHRMYGRSGRGNVIAPSVRVYHPSRLYLGAKGRINFGTQFDICRGSRVTIGNSFNIGSNVAIMTYGGEIAIGENASINPNCILYGHGGLKIGNNVMIAAATIIVPGNHRIDNIELPIRSQGCTQNGVVICDDVWIGAGCLILDGVEIGAGAVVGAGSVVTRSVAPYTVVAGNPARFLRKRGGCEKNLV